MELQTRNNQIVDLVAAPESVMRTLRGSSMSMIFQEPMTSLNPVFKISAQLIEGILLHQRCSRAQAEAQALRMLDLVRIPDAKQQPYTRALLAAVPKIGSMRGTQLPAKFALIDDDVAAGAEPAPGVAPDYQSPPVLRVESLSIRYDLKGGLLGKVRRRVHAVEGETLALVGESGCGKSTSARAIAGLMPIQGGNIVFGGKNLTTLNKSDMNSLRRDIQMVFQDPYASLNPRLTIENSLLEPLHVHGIAHGAQARKQVRILLEKVGLSAEHSVFEQPQHPYTQRLLSAVPSADLNVPRKPFSLMEESVPSRIYEVGYKAPPISYREVAAGHFVAI
eukprot:gene15702-18936_t